MRVSQFFLSTMKEAPAEAELVSHKLMLRAGLIKKLGSGLYTWMPLGLRVLRKVEQVVREEMDRSGAIELAMPAVQPAELWQESGRWEQFGPQMLKIKDRHERDFCFGPTHEEVISDIARREIKSYRQLPLNLYQIQTKFRDEIRPRVGVMRAREFVMKDAYSFDVDKAGLDRSYRVMHDAYCRVFERLGLRFRAVAADPGAIGGTGSHEFHVLADSGEDAIAYCPDSDYAANVELAEALAPAVARAAPTEAMQLVPTPGKKTCEEVAGLLGVALARTVKAVVAVAGENLVMFLLRGDHELNEIKAAKLGEVGAFRLASAEEIRERLGVPVGYMGPVGLAARALVVADRSVAPMSDFICGANQDNHHLRGVNFGRDVAEPAIVADIRNVVRGDPSPDGKGTLDLCRGIEVGHIFQLRTKYSAAMNVAYLDEAGQSQVTEMGCYGIGVSRIVAAAIEQNHDARGIIWPAALAPFDIAIVPIGYHRNEAVRAAADKLHDDLVALGHLSPGLFADQELIGVPHRVVVSERGLKDGQLEYQARRASAAEKIALQSAVSSLQSKFEPT